MGVVDGGYTNYGNQSVMDFNRKNNRQRCGVEDREDVKEIYVGWGWVASIKKTKTETKNTWRQIVKRELLRRTRKENLVTDVRFLGVQVYGF